MIAHPNRRDIISMNYYSDINHTISSMWPTAS